MPDVRCLSWHSQKPPAALRFTPSAATELYLHLRPQTESALEDLKVPFTTFPGKAKTIRSSAPAAALQHLDQNSLIL